MAVAAGSRPIYLVRLTIYNSMPAINRKRIPNYDGREGPSRSEPDAMAMERCYDAMERCYDAMERCYDAMERCYDAMRFFMIASYHRFIAIASGSERLNDKSDTSNVQL